MSARGASPISGACGSIRGRAGRASARSSSTRSCSWVAASGGRSLRLGVIAADGDATPFYERLGFVRTGEVAPLRRDPTRSVHYLIRSV